MRSRRLELFTPGTGPGQGTPLPAPSSPDARFPRIELEIAGDLHGFLLDTGASYTMVSEKTINMWSTLNPTWHRSTGARGMAAMGVPGEELLTMVSIPEVTWGPFRFAHVGVVGRPIGTFERFMSRWMVAPIVGALGNNVLSTLRVEIHYGTGVAFVSRPTG